jgi:pSer/pThr/pTyr-binding forkhead associated (FHA) protein
VLVNTDSDLEVGEFGIATRMVQPEPGQEGPSEPIPESTPGATMVYKPEGPPTQAATPGELGIEPEVVTLDENGTRHEIDKASVVIGRSKDCDIRLADPNVSRRHAELRQEDGAYWILDLGSTNGLTVNGRRQQRAKLENDDRVTIGSTDLVFRRSAS